MEGVADVDLSLLHSLLHDKEMPVSALIDWITRSDSETASSSGLLAVQKSCFSPREVLPCGSQKYGSSGSYWIAKFNETSPHSFVASFLNFVRAESQSIVASQGYSKLCPSPTDPERTSAVDNFMLPSSTQCPSDARALLMDGLVEQERTATSKLQFAAVAASNRNDTVTSNLSSQQGKAFSFYKGNCQIAVVSSPKEHSYDENFPALGARTVNRRIQKSGETHSKPKRRVNPTPMANPVVDSVFVLAKAEHGKALQGLGRSKARVPASAPLKVDMDVLMQRFERNRKQNQKDRLQSSPHESSCTAFSGKSVASSTDKLLGTDMGALDSAAESKSDHASEIQTGVAKEKRMASASLVNSSLKQAAVVTSTTVPVPKLSFCKFNSFATVHANLLIAKMVPSLLGELRFLFQLLNMDAYLHDSKSRIEESSELAQLTSDGKFRRDCGDGKKLFTHSDECSIYACAVMDKAWFILDSVGEHLLSALIEHPAITQHAPALLLRMKESLARHQAATLYSFKAYKYGNRQVLTVQQSSAASLEKQPKGHDLPGVPLFLPFEATRDSRNNFRTRESQKLYNNREFCRDRFYAIVREAAAVHNGFGLGMNAHETAAYKSLHDNVKSFMNSLVTENYPWFTELLLEQVIQAVACGETDPELTDLARQDPAKLQRLHDRLTLGTTIRASNFAQTHGDGAETNNNTHILLSPGSPWSKVKDTRKASRLKPGSHNISNENHGMQSGGGGRFDSLSFSPQFLRAYIWFLEAADSYRLNMQLMWNLKSKINRLSELSPHSRDAADIGSALTHRVLCLKALAGLLGFLYFSPGVGALPPAPCLSAQYFADAVWDAPRNDPPVDIVEAVLKATAQKSVLLTLPWVLDFVYWIKADLQALRLPYFQTAISTLQDLYMYSLLDPQSTYFGVSSICILAELDSFFEVMDFPACDTSRWHGKDESRKPDKQGATNQKEIIDTQCQIGCGLDMMVGAVDSRYIQYCCPMLMCLRMILVEAQRRGNQQNKLNSASSFLRKSIRKITPVQHPKPSQSSFTRKPLFTIEDDALSCKEDCMKVKLQQTFFEQRPQLQRLVDFVVDTAAGNAACAASLKCVPPVLEEALRKLEIDLTVKLKDTAQGLGLDHENDRGGQVEAAIEHIISSGIEKALVPAIEYAKEHATKRTSEALSALTVPNENSTVLGIAAGIAADAASAAACKKTLANISSDIRKCITQEVEFWRKNSWLSLLSKLPNGKEQNMEVFAKSCEADIAAPLEGSSMLSHAANGRDWTDNQNTMYDIFSETNRGFYGKETERQSVIINAGATEQYSNMSTVKRHLLFSNGNVHITAGNSSLLPSMCLSGLANGKVCLTKRISHCCAVALECCRAGVQNDHNRNLLRLHMAAICTFAEGMLLEMDNGLPAGGLDAIVFRHDVGFLSSYTDVLEHNDMKPNNNLCLDENTMTVCFRVERGLARRSVALALRFCLLSPFEAFGFGSEASMMCACMSPSSSALLGKIALGEVLKFSLDMRYFENSTDHEYASSVPEKEMNCPMRKHIEGPLQGFLFLWLSLVKSGIVDTNFFLSEFLTPWRWIQALFCEPWKNSGSWIQAVMHGVVSVLLEMISEARNQSEAEKYVIQLLEEIYNEIHFQEVVHTGKLRQQVKLACNVHSLREEVKTITSCITKKLLQELSVL